jgi:hypothetical protein
MRLGSLLIVAPFSLSLFGQGTQEKSPPPSKPKATRPELGNRLRIEVTGGEKNQPVENASVYVKFVEPRKLRKDKKYEMNVKTNRDGIAQVPDAPEGRVLIQVIAEGWKTFGRWYDLDEPQSTVKIRLERPVRWY